DPWGVQPRPLQDLVVFVVVTATIVVATFLSSLRLFRPLQEWRERLHRGADPAEVPAHLRRRALNRPLIAATFSMTGWTLAGIFYLPYQLWVVGFGLKQAWRVFAGIVVGGGAVVVALLVARFITRPGQALRSAMAQVAAGDLDVRVPVRSTDELGELNERFNAMVEELRRAARTRELFGRYVSRAVAEQALERGIALGGRSEEHTSELQSPDHL